MNRSTFRKIKYMNRLGFFKGRVYDWGWFQNTDSYTRTKITPSPPPHNHRGYERVYKGVGFKILTSTPVLKSPRVLPLRV